ncbi:ubiquitin carboxyl-terminal hydrolase 9X-like [Styela clava]
MSQTDERPKSDIIEDSLPPELSSTVNRKTNNSPVNDQPPPPYKSLNDISPPGDKNDVVRPSSLHGSSRQPVQHDDTAVETHTVQVSGGGDADSSLEEVAEQQQTTTESENEFSESMLADLDDLINQPRWVVPVLPGGQLELLQKAAIKLVKSGLDTKNEACQRFFRDGLTISFSKILTDEAVSGWKLNIHKCIYNNAELLVELCVAKLRDDWMPLLDLLAMVFNPLCKFHIYNGNRSSSTDPPGGQVNPDELFARTADSRQPKGWLVDLVNKFGKLEGFKILLERFESGTALNLAIIYALIRPFGEVADLITPRTVQTYLVPITRIIISCLEGLTDDELKKEASKSEQRNDTLSAVIKFLRKLMARLPTEDGEIEIRSLEMFRLKMILRLLQIPSFSSKMNALNEVNKVINNVSYYSAHAHRDEEEEWLTSERMAEWLKENQVLSIVLRDSLHQPQYVEKLETILRFVIKEKSLSMEDLDSIWAAQAGKHSTIVQNVHELLTKLAWDFSPEQLDHLFELFKQSWEGAKKKQRETLLELIRRLAEDDKDGVMAHKVLNLLWNLAHSEDASTEIIDQALTAHKKILDYSCTQDRDGQKKRWITKAIDELKNDNWVIPALRQIQEICQLFNEAPQNYQHVHRNQHVLYRHNVISNLQDTYSMVTMVATNLSSYLQFSQEYLRENPDYDPQTVRPGSRYTHIQEVNERLHFLRFLLKDGQLWLCEPQARQIWHCLAENAAYVSDRESCFQWFSELMGEEPDLDPEIMKAFFENNILQLDPSLLTAHGMLCFERFFKSVNCREQKLVQKRQSGSSFMVDNLELIGLEYLWRVLMNGTDEIAGKAIELLQETYTNLGPQLRTNQAEIHEDFVQSCMDRLKASLDTIQILVTDKSVSSAENNPKINFETQRMIRVLTVLQEYITECDQEFMGERTMLPTHRACRGYNIVLVIRVALQSRQNDEFEVWTHSNATLGSVRKQILSHFKNVTANNTNVEMYVNGEVLLNEHDRKLISNLPLKDRTHVSVKLVPIKPSSKNKDVTSSPDSSSDSSRSSPTFYLALHEPNPEVEALLPGVIMSKKPKYAQFLFQVADLGCELDVSELRDGARNLLQLMPCNEGTVQNIQQLTEDIAKSKMSVPPKPPSAAIESLFFLPSSSETLYNLQVLYAMLLPAERAESREKTTEVQKNFLLSGGIQVTIDMLVRDNFIARADPHTKCAALTIVLQVAKLMFTSVAYARVASVVEALQEANSASSGQSQQMVVSPTVRNQAGILQNALSQIPNPTTHIVLKSVAVRLGQGCHKQVKDKLPDLNTVKAVMKLAWCSGSGSLHLMNASNEELHEAYEKNGGMHELSLESILLCQEALEVLTIMLATYPPALESLHKDKSWQKFVIDLLLLCPNRDVRLTAVDQFLLMSTKCVGSTKPLVFFITLLFTVLLTTVREYALQSTEFFMLLCRLLNYAYCTNIQLQNSQVLLNNEIEWLKKVRENSKAVDEQSVDNTLLAGHLCICKELLSFLSPEKKKQVGSEKNGPGLIKELIEDFLFPASCKLMRHRIGAAPVMPAMVKPICEFPSTISSAFDCLAALCHGSVPNLRLVAHMLSEMFYSEQDQPLCDWEYLPPVGQCPSNGFVGLKNAGATCYMNAVIQQLFMIPTIRDGILAADNTEYGMKAIESENEGFEEQDQDRVIEGKEENDESSEIINTSKSSSDACKPVGSKSQERIDYICTQLHHFQVIFGHLAKSKLQYFVPKAFWKHFRLANSTEPVNLREQHDALEFFSTITEDLDEGLKHLKQPPLFKQVFGGRFSDQKICKGCPHRYSNEGDFMPLNIDILLHQNLIDSLENYVKGDLLEGDNAYTCERCNKKVDTVKRMCFKKLPPVLSIQLMRFKYDYDRKCPIKYNDYFEFTREIDMEPYTVSGLSKIEGEVIDENMDDADEDVPTKYRLVGVVVHSGQASGGHYYSYILQRSKRGDKWYKFDDGDVQECNFDDDELKNQCFGGEYVGEVFDHMMKRMSYRRQKRWWNAYLLFYERVDVTRSYELSKSLHDLSLGSSFNGPKLPKHVEQLVQDQNIEFMHNKMQFSPEYFTFMQRLLRINNEFYIPDKIHGLQEDAEKLAMISTQLAAKFLFTTGLHTKKTVRGAAIDWYETLYILLQCSKHTRSWFIHNVLFSNPSRISEYLLESLSTEIRAMFAKLLVFLAHYTMSDGFVSPPEIFRQSFSEPQMQLTLSDYILHSILLLLHKEVAENGRHLTQYFSLFLMFANLGPKNKHQLLKMDVPYLLMKVALDEGPGPPIKYQYAELGKLYAVVSLLIRCCDVSMYYHSSKAGTRPLPMPMADRGIKQPLMQLQANVAEKLFTSKNYMKKIIEDNNTADDTVKLLRYCCWENPAFSGAVLSQLLWHVSFSYTHELRPFLDLLFQVLMIQDSWQTQRIINALKGIPDDRDGLFATIQRSKSHYAKRAYQCIKSLTVLFSNCEVAYQLLMNNGDMKKKWSWAVEWLGDELERRTYGSGSGMQYSYNNWSPPAQSNETSNGYFLERSPSARLTLQRACQLLPEDEPEEVDNVEDSETDPCPMSDPTVGTTYTQAENQESEAGTSGTSTTEQIELHSGGTPSTSSANINLPTKAVVSGEPKQEEVTTGDQPDGSENTK